LTEQKMKQINAWFQKVNKNKLEMQDKMAVAGITMEMLEKLEPIYDKYNGRSCGLARKQRL
jgi:hypothetical protein